MKLCFACDAERTLSSSSTYNADQRKKREEQCGQNSSDSSSLSSSSGDDSHAGVIALSLSSFPAGTKTQNLQDHFTQHGFVILRGILDDEFIAGVLHSEKVEDILTTEDINTMLANIKTVATHFFTTDQISMQGSFTCRYTDADDRAARVDRCLAGKLSDEKCTSSLFNQVGNLKVHVVLDKVIQFRDELSLVPGSHKDFFRVFSNTELMKPKQPTLVEFGSYGMPRRNSYLVRGMDLLSLKPGDVVFLNDKVVLSRAWRIHQSAEHEPGTPRSRCSTTDLPDPPPHIPFAWVGQLDEEVRMLLLSAVDTVSLEPIRGEWKKGHEYAEGMLQCLSPSAQSLVTVRKLSRPGTHSTVVANTDEVMVVAAPPAIRAFRDAFCDINDQRLRDLFHKMLEIVPDWAGEFDIHNLLGWVAVQKHSGIATEPPTASHHHRDSLLRLLLVSVTLRNGRTLWVQGTDASPCTTESWTKKIPIAIPQGAVYVANATAFDHHPEFAMLQKDDSSIVLQMSLSLPKSCIKLCTAEMLAGLGHAFKSWLAAGTLWIPTLAECESRMWSSRLFSDMTFSVLKQKDKNPPAGKLREPLESSVGEVAARIHQDRNQVFPPAARTPRTKRELSNDHASFKRVTDSLSIRGNVMCENPLPLLYVKVGMDQSTSAHQERFASGAFNCSLPHLLVPRTGNIEPASANHISGDIIGTVMPNHWRE